MDIRLNTIKDSLDKIVLLGILILSLVFARLIIFTKPGVYLSEPIYLQNTGLSVSVPVSGGWKSSQNWTFSRGRFSLYSKKANHSVLACSYTPTAESFDPGMFFQQIVSQTKGRIVMSDKIEISGLPFNWARIDSRTESIFWGIIILPGDHSFDIMLSTQGNPAQAETIFRSVAESLNFDNR